MAFENHQQDAFDLRNDTERIKQFEAELNKATTSIGAAEIAAEKELAELKLKNLAEQQEVRLKQLDRLIELEDKGIRELAKARLTLSDRQFELRKKEIKKEFQLAKNAAEELLRIKNKKVKPATEQATSTAKDIKTASKTSSGAGNSVAKKSSRKTTLVTPVQKTAGAKSTQTSQPAKVEPREFSDGSSKLEHVDIGRRKFAEVAALFEASQNAIHKQSLAIEKALNDVTANKGQATSQSSIDIAGELLDNFNSAENTVRKIREFNENRALAERLTKLAEEQKLRLGHEEASFTAITAKISAAAKAEDLKNNESRYFQEAYWSQQQAFANECNKLIDDRIKTEAALAYTRANRDKLIAQEEQKLQNAHEESAFKAMQDHITITAKKNDLEQNRKLYAEEEYRKLNLAFLEEQNKLAQEEIATETALEFAKNNEARLLDQAAHRLRISQMNAEHAAMQAIIDAQAKADDIKNNRGRYLEEELQKLKTGHINALNELNLAAIANEAKADDIKNNKEAYALEARIARENAFYDERNKLEEERIKVEEEIAWERAHSDEILAQELQKKRLSYLKEYQEYQKKAGKYAISIEDFEKDKAKKDNKAAKDDATSGITDAIKTGQFYKIWSTENKEKLTQYMGQRTAELEDAYMAKFDSDNPEATEEERTEAKKKAEASAKLTAQFELVANAARDLAQTLNAQTDKIGAKQAPIDTRLQGSRANDTILGSYWKQLARDMNSIGAVNPYFKQEVFANNIETLVNKGISFDVKQRAFLMTIQEKIANTFEVADGTLLRLIRIQQQDTTAGRLGMESALNSFLNSMYETSEYLTDVASSVRSSLGEMQALMDGAAGTELEFQVQKWMGSLYSVGMSQDAVRSIAQTFGQIASGDVSGLTGNGTGNLLIMAANEAGKSIADILQDGLDAKETNELMQAMVNYLAEIAETSSDSRVVQQQLANVYGIKASDLRAATNLASSIKDVSKQDLTYGGMLGQLNKMANSMILRTSTGEMLTNVWDNVQYTMATQMANDPVLYLLPRVATLLEDYAGGIDLPFLNVMGFGVDLNTSVAQLMNVAALSGSILGALGPMMSGLAAATSGSMMLNIAGINTSGKAPVIARGSATPLQHLGGSSISESGYIGNASGEDVKNATLQDAEDSKKKQMVEAKDEESSDDVVIRSQQAIIDIYNLLEEVAHGSQSLRVRVIDNASGGGGGAAAGAPGGVDNGNWVLSI